MKTKKMWLGMLLAILLGGCNNPMAPDSETVTSLNLTGLIPAPVTGAAPVTSISDTAGSQYLGAVVWKAGDAVLSGNFGPGTIYTAELTLTPAAGYGFAGLG